MNNWQKLGLKSMDEGIKYVLSFLKKNEKVIAERGFGDGSVSVGGQVMQLNGSKMKRKKEVIYGS